MVSGIWCIVADRDVARFEPRHFAATSVVEWRHVEQQQRWQSRRVFTFTIDIAGVPDVYCAEPSSGNGRYAEQQQ